jgi:transcriptional regulator of acetoin/glycerol metabolism
VSRANQKGSTVSEHFPTLAELEREHTARALRMTNGNMRAAAKLLGIGRATLYRRIARDAASQELELLREIGFQPKETGT